MPCAGTTHDFDSLFGTSVDQHVPTQGHGGGQDPFTDSYAVPHYQPQLPLLPIHLDLSLTFDIPSRSLNAHARHTVQAQCVNATTLTLNAEDFLTLQVTSPDDSGLAFSYDGHFVRILLSKPLPKGDRLVLDVHYSVQDPIDGLLYSTQHDGFFVVSDHETERARYWLPVVDHPVVRTTITFDIHTPAEHKLTALANGELVRETIADGVKTTSWKMDQPTPSYILCVAIGRFIREDVGNHNGKPVSFFAPEGARIPYSPKSLQLTFGRTVDMIQFMEDKVKIDLPWPKYFQWAVGEVGGAMENSSLVSYDEWYLLDERSCKERAHRVDSTVVHELAHTWFGDMVVCADFCHSFLKESFATLISAEWYEKKNGNDDFQFTLTQYANGAIAETNDYVRPIVTRRYDSSWSLFDSHLYVNGAWRLHMLRCKLGDEQFWNAVTFYLRKRAWKTVEADDFRRDLEEYTGEELSSYFEQWYYSKGHPVIDMSFAHDAKKGQCTITVKQTQQDDKKGIPHFDIALDVAIETAAGVWQTHSLGMHDRMSTAQVIVKVDGKPLQVVVDPDMKVLFHLAKVSGVHDDMSLRMLTDAPTFAGRHQGMRLLRDSGSNRARAALCEGLQMQGHWGMRLLIAQALGKCQWGNSLAGLIAAMDAEKDARVVPAIVGAVGEFRDQVAGDALLAFVQEGQQKQHGYGAMAAALRGLGRQEDGEVHVELLTSFVRDEERRGGSFEMAQGAAMGLGLVKKWSAVEALMSLLDGSANGEYPGRVRAAIVRAISNGMVWEGKAKRMQVFDFLERRCRKEAPKAVRLAFGSALSGLADAGSVTDALNDVEKRVDYQSKMYVRLFRKRAIRVSNGRDSGVKSFAGAMEKLQKEVKELRGKIEELNDSGNDKVTESKTTVTKNGNNNV